MVVQIKATINPAIAHVKRTLKCVKVAAPAVVWTGARPAFARARRTAPRDYALQTLIALPKKKMLLANE